MDDHGGVLLALASRIANDRSSVTTHRDFAEAPGEGGQAHLGSGVAAPRGPSRSIAPANSAASPGSKELQSTSPCELIFENMHVPADVVLGGVPGKGFGQMMKGLETGRIQVASRALGVGQAAFDDALRYSQERESFGKPI